MSERTIKNYEELQFRDDFMFGKVMEDSNLCRDVLECLLGREIGELTEVRTQKEYRYTSDGKPIRLDVYNEDSRGEIFDTEMENLNHKSPEAHMLPQRSRFYQASIDIDYLNKNNSYNSLPESHVLFICTFDPFRHGLSRYTFREKCEELCDLRLDDGTTKVFFNCTYKGDDITDELRELYDYIETGIPGDGLTGRIDEAVVRGRKNEIWRSQYMKEIVILQDARNEGIEIGIERGIEQNIVSMICKKLLKGKEASVIADEIEEPLDRVQRICEVASKYLPDYDTGKIIEELKSLKE